MTQPRSLVELKAENIKKSLGPNYQAVVLLQLHSLFKNPKIKMNKKTFTKLVYRRNNRREHTLKHPDIPLNQSQNNAYHSGCEQKLLNKIRTQVNKPMKVTNRIQLLKKANPELLHWHEYSQNVHICNKDKLQVIGLSYVA